MITRQQILQLMPAANGRTKMEYARVINQDIIKTIHKNVPRAVEITKPIAYLFQGPDVESTARNIWNFLKTQITYVKDDTNQNIKLPNRFVLDGTGDCKSYSLFANAIFTNLGIKSPFRYTSYDPINPTPQHVYGYAFDNGKTIICDGVWNSFNNEKKYTFKKEYMPVNTLSGTDQEIGLFKKQREKAKEAVNKAVDKVKGEIKKDVQKVQTAVKKEVKNAQTAAKNTGIIKAVEKVQDNAKNTAVVKAAAKAQSNVKVIAKKGADILKQVPNAAKVVIGAPARRAFRTLVAANFHNYANKLAGNPKTFEIWKSLGGIREELEQSIKAGQKRKAILGIGCMDCQIKQVNGIGAVEIATIAAILAAATPVIIALSSVLKETLQTIQAAKNAGGDTQVDENGNPNTNNSGGNSSPGSGSGGGSGSYYDPNAYNGGGGTPYTNTDAPSKSSAEDQPEPEKKDNTALLVGGALLAKILFF